MPGRRDQNVVRLQISVQHDNSTLANWYRGVWIVQRITHAQGEPVDASLQVEVIQRDRNLCNVHACNLSRRLEIPSVHAASIGHVGCPTCSSSCTIHSSRDIKSPPGRYSITRKRFRLRITDACHGEHTSRGFRPLSIASRISTINRSSPAQLPRLEGPEELDDERTRHVGQDVPLRLNLLDLQSASTWLMSFQFQLHDHINNECSPASCASGAPLPAL